MTSPSSGVQYCEAHPSATPLPLDDVISGRVVLEQRPECFLAYSTRLETGLCLPGELQEHAGKPCFVKFTRVMDIYETMIPEANRGHRLGEVLARAAFAIADAEGYRVDPSCTYIAHFVSKFHQYQPQLVLSTKPQLHARRAGLCKMKVKQVAAECEQAGLLKTGSKAALIERIIGHEFDRAPPQKSPAVQNNRPTKRAKMAAAD